MHRTAVFLLLIRQGLRDREIASSIIKYLYLGGKGGAGGGTNT